MEDRTEKTRRKVFDAHFHIGEFGTRTYCKRSIMPIAAEYTDYRACASYMQKHKISVGLVVPTYVEDQEVNFHGNRLVLDCVDAIDNVLGGLWVSPLPDDESQTKCALASARHPKIRALKMSAGTWQGSTLDPATWSARMRQNMEYIVSEAILQNLVLQLHTGSGASDPLNLERFMEVYGSEGRFHFVHMGEATDGILKFVPRFLQWLQSGYDVFTDQAMVPAFGPQWLIRELLVVHGTADRLLFATDSPWSSFEAEYATIESLDVPERIKAGVFWGNAIALYGPQ